MTNVITYATISEIKALTAATTLTDLYYSTDSGSTGFWRRSPSPEPNTNANEGTILKNTDNYIWRRIVENKTYYVAWYNVPDATAQDPFSGSDATAALTTVLNSVVSGGTLVFPDGKIYSISNLNIKKSITIRGKATLRKRMAAITSDSQASPSLPVLRIEEGVKGVSINDITIDGNEVYYVNDDTPYNIPKRFTRNYYDGYGAQLYGLFIESDGIKFVSELELNNVTIRNTYNEAIYSDCVSEFSLLNSTIENCGMPSFTRWYVPAQGDPYIQFRYTAAVRLTYEKNKGDNEFKNIRVEGCKFLQTAKKNGCFKLHVVCSEGSTYANAKNYVSNVSVLNNECYIGENKNVTVVKPNVVDPVPLSTSEDELAILCFELFTKLRSTINNLNVIGNNIISETLQNPSVPLSPSWVGKRPHTMGISLGGNAAIEGEGIYNANILHNQITGCRKNGLELSGNYVVASYNNLVDCAFISVTATYMEAGMRQITISHNTVIANPGYARTNGFFVYFAGLVVQAIDNNIDELTIEENTFDIQHTILSGVDQQGNAVQVDISNQLVDSIYIKSGIPSSPGSYAKINNLNILNNRIMGIMQNGITFDVTSAVENLKIAGNSFQYYEEIPDPNAGSDFPYYAIQFKSTRSTSGDPLMHKLFILNNTFEGGQIVQQKPLEKIDGVSRGGQIVGAAPVANKKGNGLFMDSTYTTDIFFCGNMVKDVSIGVWTKRAVDRLVMTNNSFIKATIYETNVTNSTNKLIEPNLSVVA